ncbi:MAG TPA: hypothetical protein VNO30_41565 [Kofleriaceae bacterium]|nr:hypothetical protein [Kofleriaceae bacterium]
MREVRLGDRDRLLAALDPSRARPAAATARTRNQTAAPRREPATRGRPAATRRSRKLSAAAEPRAQPAGAEPARATAATATPAATEAAAAARVDAMTGAAANPRDTAAERAAAPGAEGSSSSPADMSASSAATAETPGPAATEAAQAGTAVGQRGKRMKWTRDSIVEELARWMVAGTSIDASFLKRNGPPGLVPAALRIFGRFDAALNVAGLHVAKLYPAGPPAPDGLAVKRSRRPAAMRSSAAADRAR